MLQKYRSARILLGSIASSVVLFPISAQAVTFNFTGAIDNFNVPTTGVYRINANGAQGSPFFGGLGGNIAADFNLSAGEILRILVGSAGIDSLNSGARNSNAGGGGGGTFVVLNNAPLVIAGGGFGGGGGGTVAALTDNGGIAFKSDGGFGGSGGSFSFTTAGKGGNGSNIEIRSTGSLPTDLNLLAGGGGGGSGGYDPTRLADPNNLVATDGSNSLGNRFDGRVTIDFLRATAPITTAVPEPLTIIGTIIGGTAAMRLRTKLKSTGEK